MTRADHHTPPSGDRALVALEREIAETREQLGRTVEELAAKADVPARAKAKASDAAARMRRSAMRARRAETRTMARAGRAGERGAGRASSAGPEPVDPTAPGRGGGPVVAQVRHAGVRVSRLPADRVGVRWAYGGAAVGLAAAAVGVAVWERGHA